MGDAGRNSFPKSRYGRFVKEFLKEVCLMRRAAVNHYGSPIFDDGARVNAHCWVLKAVDRGFPLGYIHGERRNDPG